MKEILIEVLPNQMGVLSPKPSKIDLGTVRDNNARRITFVRAPEYEAFDLVLRFFVGDKMVYRENIGQLNSFDVGMPLTQSPRLRMNLSYQDGDTFREGAGDVFIKLRSISVGDCR